jgi:hypothetical protein
VTKVTRHSRCCYISDTQFRHLPFGKDEQLQSKRACAPVASSRQG